MTIKIYKPSKTSMQSGFKKTKLWLAEYISEVEKVKDSLMGWNSSLDTKSQIKLFFDTIIVPGRRRGMVCTAIFMSNKTLDSV